MIDPRNPDFTNTPIDPRRPVFQYGSGGPAALFVTVLTVGGSPDELANTYDSLRRQSFPHWRWLIQPFAAPRAGAADGWTPPEAERRVTVLKPAGAGGRAGALNAAWPKLETAHVLLLDAGDLLEPTALEKMLWRMEIDPALGVVGAFSVRFGVAPELRPAHAEPGQSFERPARSSGLLLRRAALPHGVSFNESVADARVDGDFLRRLATAGVTAAVVSEHLVWNAASGVQTGENEPQAAERSGEPSLDDEFKRPARRPQPAFAAPRAAPPFQNPLEKSKPRLLLVTQWLTLGGADKFNLDVIRQLAARGWEISLAPTLPGENVWKAEFARHTPDIFPLADFLAPSDQPAFLRSLIESRRPDVVLVTNSELGYQLLPYLRSVCPEPAYVDCSHMEEPHWKNGGFPRYAAAMQDWLDRNLVVSRHLKGWLIAAGAEADKIDVVHINVDPQVWRPDAELRRRVRARFDAPDGRPLLLYPVRLCEQKQPRVFAGALRELAARGHDFLALAAGDGPDRPWLEAFVRENKLETRIRLLGPQSSAQVRELMAACDVLFLPSQWEGIALSIYEAMACGLAVVAADVGGQRELVTPDTGVLVRPENAETAAQCYADALAKLLADPRRRETLGRNARRRIESGFTLDAMAEALLAAFARAKQARAAPPRPALPPRAAQECAVQAVEYFRLANLSGQMWVDERRRTAADATPLRRIEELEQAKIWLEEQNAGWRRTVERNERLLRERYAQIEELERAKAWLAEQCENWRRAAEGGEKTIREQRAQIEELEQAQRWLAEQHAQIEELERAKRWLAEQGENWRRAAEGGEQAAREQRARIDELEQAKTWLAEQAANWQQTAERGEQTIREQRDWIQKLEEAKTWLDQQRRHWMRKAGARETDAPPPDAPAPPKSKSPLR